MDNVQLTFEEKALKLIAKTSKKQLEPEHYVVSWKPSCLIICLMPQAQKLKRLR